MFEDNWSMVWPKIKKYFHMSLGFLGSIETFKKRHTVHLRTTSKGLLEEADTRGDAILLLALDSFNFTMAYRHLKNHQGAIHLQADRENQA